MSYSDRAEVPVAHGPWVLGSVSALLQLAVGVPYLFAFILAPGAVVLVLWATWLAMTLALARRWRHGAGKSLLLYPPATLVLWFAVLAGAQAVSGGWSV